MQTHLYRRRATYYWRRLVPTTLQPLLGSRDLRVSLRTNLPATARSRARQMDAAFDFALEELERIMQSGQVLSEAQKSAIVREIRSAIINEFDERRLAAGIRTAEEQEAAVAKALRLQEAVRQLIKTNDLARAAVKLDPVLARDGITLDKQSPEYLRLARDVLVGLADGFSIIADQEDGRYYDPDGPRPTKVVVATESDGIRTEAQIKDDKANLKALFSVHAKAHVEAKMTSDKWGWDHHRDAHAAFELFKQFTGDKPVGHYTKANAIEFVKQLRRMPVGIGQRHPYIGISALEGIRKADEIEAENLQQAEAEIQRRGVKGADADKLRGDARVARVSITTVVKHRDHCNAVFKYLQEILNVSFKNPFFGVRPDRPTRGDVREDREKYSDAQIQTIFASPIWAGCKSEYFFCQEGQKIFKEERYWVPLIAAFTGMRLEEICQLWLDDVVCVDGIWCLEIWKGPERQLKNGPSERRIPIPDILIKLGLLDRVKRLRKAGGYRLFPELERGTKIDPRTGLGRLGPSLTRSLGRYFKLWELADPNMLFHSFRHTFASALDDAGVLTKDIADIMGHVQEGSESQRRYIKRARLIRLKGYMERVNYGLVLVERDGEWHIAKPE